MQSYHSQDTFENKKNQMIEAYTSEDYPSAYNYYKRFNPKWYKIENVGKIYNYVVMIVLRTQEFRSFGDFEDWHNSLFNEYIHTQESTIDLLVLSEAYLVEYMDNMTEFIETNDDANKLNPFPLKIHILLVYLETIVKISQLKNSMKSALFPALENYVINDKEDEEEEEEEEKEDFDPILKINRKYSRQLIKFESVASQVFSNFDLSGGNSITDKSFYVLYECCLLEYYGSLITKDKHDMLQEKLIEEFINNAYIPSINYELFCKYLLLYALKMVRFDYIYALINITMKSELEDLMPVIIIQLLRSGVYSMATKTQELIETVILNEKYGIEKLQNMIFKTIQTINTLFIKEDLPRIESIERNWKVFFMKSGLIISKQNVTLDRFWSYRTMCKRYFNTKDFNEILHRVYSACSSSILNMLRQVPEIQVRVSRIYHDIGQVFYKRYLDGNIVDHADKDVTIQTRIIRCYIAAIRGYIKSKQPSYPSDSDLIDLIVDIANFFSHKIPLDYDTLYQLFQQIELMSKRATALNQQSYFIYTELLKDIELMLSNFDINAPKIV